MTARPELRRVAVLNRGEPAVRFLRALREYNLERGAALEAVAFYTDPDAGAPFVRLADDAVALGAPLVDGPGGRPVSAYCHHERVIAHLRAARCDAVWPGWGFASEDADFVALLEAAGVVFLGPPAAAMRRLGDKIAARHLALETGVPLAPWAVLDEGADPVDAARAIGYPLMVKASAGGGGRGIRRVSGPGDLAAAVAAVRNEVAKVFGAGGVLLEACVLDARHVEVQIVATDERAFALGVRDCSVQRRHQKVAEEAPSPVLPATVADELCAAAVRLAERAGYRGAGTVEFLYRPSDGLASFLEVNARLQVEHTVTEMVTGDDLVKAQIDVARGLPWAPCGVARGHAIEVRLNAEDPEQGFRPAPGLVRLFRVPSGPGVRVDSGVAEDMAIAPQFDSMVAKVIAWGADRRQAIARLVRALREMEVVVEDGATNKAFLLDVLAHPAFLDGTAHTGWLDRAMAAGEMTAPAYAFEALLAAAVLEYRRQHAADVQRFFAQVQNGIPQHLPAPEGLQIDLRLRGVARALRVFALGRGRYLVGAGDALHPVFLETTGEHSLLLAIGDRRHKVLFAYGRAGISVEVDGAVHTIERASGGTVRAPAPAMVVHVAVREGDAVRQGDVLCTVEAMKLEMSLFAPEAGVVRAVLCRANQQVSAGQPLLMLDPEAAPGTSEVCRDAGDPAPAPRPLDRLLASGAEVVDALPEPEATAVVADLVDAVESMLLGFDVAPALASRVEAFFEAGLDEPAHPSRWAPLAGLLAVFADAESLFDRNLLPVAGEAAAAPAETAFYEFCRRHLEGEAGAPAEARPALLRALRRYGIAGFEPADAVRRALWRLAAAHAHGELRHRLCSALLRAVMSLHAAGVRLDAVPGLRETLDRVAQVADPDHRAVEDNARQAAYVLFEQQRFVQRRRQVETVLDAALGTLAAGDRASAAWRRRMDALVRSPHSLLPLLFRRDDDGPRGDVLAEATLRRLYAERRLAEFALCRDGALLRASFRVEDDAVAAVLGPPSQLREMFAFCAPGTAPHAVVGGVQRAAEIIVRGLVDRADFARVLEAAASSFPDVARVTVSWADGRERLRHRTYERGVEVRLLRDIHPEAARRVELWRLSEFELERLEAPEQLYAFHARARANPRDERIFIFAEVRDVPLRAAAGGRDEHLWEFEQAYFEALRVIRQVQARRSTRERLHGNRLVLHVRPVVRLTAADVAHVARRLEAPARPLGLDKTVIQARVRDAAAPEGFVRKAFVVDRPGRHRLEVREREWSDRTIRALSPYGLRVLQARRLGTIYPYELARMLAGGDDDVVTPHADLRGGTFVEHDLAADDTLVPVARPPGGSVAGVVVGLMTHHPERYPDGLERVWIAADATRAMGALAEPECRRILAALDLAAARDLPVEWVALSSGARIAMDSGTENLDWTARVLRRIVRFTEEGGVIHVIVPGVNVGAQAYWDAEATMLQHTRGALIMTADGAMVLTGKKALEYAGSVSAEDERGIGGFERIMGPNGQAQYFARDLGDAYRLLFEHYRYTYRRPGEGGPRAHATRDPAERDVRLHPYRATFGEPFRTVGDLFDPHMNPGRKTPFAIREVMGAVVDQDQGHLERWRQQRYAETAVVWDACLGGHPVCLIGFESHPMPRRGRVPLDGPETWTGGTLFPQSSKKVARAINAASGNRPVVVLANLSGFDGSPESLRKLQLEHGAEIGRAVVNFRGAIVFVVIGRYHGGAYVVFSKALNPRLTALAVEGSYASVIGGAPAAAVVFPREVRARADADARVVASRRALASAAPADRPRLREQHEALYAQVLLEAQGDVAREFDAVHTVERAVRVGSLDAVIPAAALRPALIEAIRRP